MLKHHDLVFHHEWKSTGLVADAPFAIPPKWGLHEAHCSEAMVLDIT
jgi:hypothetical protein